MLLQISMIILGFILLILGANLLIKGSVNIAKKFHIPEILIGLTIVALGTSMPELIVTITSANKGAGDLIIGNAIGSNLCNLLLILGLMAILKPIKVDKDAKKIHIPISFLATLLVLIMGLGILYGEVGVINRVDGIILTILSVIYFIYPIIIEIKYVGARFHPRPEKKLNLKSVGETISRPQQEKKTFLSIICIFIGIISLKYGGDIVVEYCIEIARMFNISERVIGLTVIAIGTAFPELVTSILAVIKKDTDLAVGNLVGSCILNLLLILGVGAIITPLTLSSEFIQNLVILLVTNLIILIFCFIGKKHTVTKQKGLVLLAFFSLYICSLFA